ncbi:serine protease 38 precursor-like protein, partial [Leptotrombidium deliense]
CGIEGWKERVVGGRESIPYIYPWLVSLINEDRDPYCGGSLISNDYVLTAAHCVIDTENNNEPKKKSHVRIVFGAHDMFKRRKTLTFRVQDWKVHPNFQSVDNYDIALIKLKIPPKLRKQLTSKFMPICLPDVEFSRSNKFIVAGWGQVKTDGFWSRKLLEATVNGTSLQDCRDKFDDQNLITDRHLCAGNSKRDSCKGDSGGPLMQKKRGKMYLHGIASYGDE